MPVIHVHYVQTQSPAARSNLFKNKYKQYQQCKNENENKQNRKQTIPRTTYTTC